MPDKAIPIELKFDENVLRNAKALGRLQGVFFMILLRRILKGFAEYEKSKQEKEES